MTDIVNEEALEITVETDKLTLPEIKWNKEAIQEKLDIVLKKYKGLEFTPDQLVAAKKDLAAIRGVKTSLNDEKKTVKKTWNINYITFEDEIKTMMASLDLTIEDIDDQVKSFEEVLKENRRKEIRFLKEWIEVADHMEFNETWLLKKWVSTDDKKLKELLKGHKEEIDRKNKIVKAQAVTYSMEPTFYLEKLKEQQLDQVLERMSEDYMREQQKKEIEREEAAAENETIVPIPGVVKNAPVGSTEPMTINKDERVLEFTRLIKGTKTQLVMLKAYADQIGVEII
jgi:hypothetical protein